VRGSAIELGIPTRTVPPLAATASSPGTHPRPRIHLGALNVQIRHLDGRHLGILGILTSTPLENLDDHTRATG
jgi:hypothetical protein